MFTSAEPLVSILWLVIICIGLAGLAVIVNDAENDDDAGYTL
jgi:hypothetical protein